MAHFIMMISQQLCGMPLFDSQEDCTKHYYTARSVAQLFRHSTGIRVLAKFMKLTMAPTSCRRFGYELVPDIVLI